ncbi:potassium transport protein TRK1/TRK2 [Xylariomycetidae sp. FL0641]|nr:potassium transport protein TRK1/TRK2 [Xylariomycetidae sp. FL0641]
MPDTREHILDFIQALRPSFISRNPHFSFITTHYFWIIGWTILGSVLIFATAGGQLDYTDALFFAAGANTQAGLNTVDMNLLNTFQQLVIYFCSLLSNPITIHSSVVFLRLYWFEKRFQHIVKEANQRRPTITKTRSKARPAPDPEKGVNGRHITVMHNTAKASRMTNDGVLLDTPLNEPFKEDPLANASASQSEEDSDRKTPEERQQPLPTQIRFSNRVKIGDTRGHDEDDDDDPVPLPSRRTNAEHIAILEKQRKADKSVLRIPGPRDSDRGAMPEELEEDDEVAEDGPNFLNRRRRPSSLEPPMRRRRPSSPTRPRAERQPTITIEEPARPPRDELNRTEPIAEDVEATTNDAGGLKYRKPRKDGEELHQTETATSAMPRPTPLQRIRTAITQNKEGDPMPYLSWQPTMGRNSAFIGLSEEQREELGGIEYRSLKTLALVLTVYFWGYSILAIICLVPWILHNNEYWGSIVESDGINKTWWGFWTANAAFMDLGYTLTPDSMVSFNTAIFPLLIMSIFIVLGNTGFPIALRFMIWLASLVVPRGSGMWEELRFLLDHPRRCFTLLFPSNANWWLFFILVALNGIDLILFIVLDLGTGAVADLPLNIRFLDGWFQAASTRTAGFSCVNLAELHPAVQTSYLIMMYISVFPVAISIRRTNVYEEKSLGVFQPGLDEEDDNQTSISYVGTHLRRQLSFDLWYIFIGYFILTISEGPRIQKGDFSMFAVLFEVVSAYGTVGLSLGYTGVNTSLSGQFTVVGKLVIIAMMIRGRHRGLPYGLDRAVLLPSENLNRKEAEEAELRLQRRQSAVTLGRQASLARGRSRSVDRRNPLAGLLHPGPTIPRHSFAKTEQSFGAGRSETLRKYTTASRHNERFEEEPVSPGFNRRTEHPQPGYNH